MVEELTNYKLSFAVFVVAFVLSGLTAYSFIGVPFDWISKVLYLLAYTIVLGFNQKLPKSYNYLLFVVLIALVSNVINWKIFEMPSRATTDYHTFIILRYFNYLLFFTTTILVYKLANKFSSNLLVKWINFACILIIVVSIYTYFAQIFGFWEPTRNRIGTGGQDFILEEIRYSYAFHRFTGTFREPSHLATFLILPFFLFSSQFKTKFGLSHAIIIILILLTGSLLGVLSLICGYLFYNYTNSKKPVFSVSLVFAILSIILLINDSFGNVYLQTITGRIELLLSQGYGNSNRGFQIDVISSNPSTLFGYGFGNSNLFLASITGNPLVPSYLNLFINTLYSTGYVGLFFMVIFFFSSFRFIYDNKINIPAQGWTLVGALVCYFIIYIVNDEELSINHSIIFGLLLSIISKNSKTVDE